LDPEKDENSHKYSNKIKYDFIPSNQMQYECQLPRKNSILDSTSDQITKKELPISKISEVCQLDIDQT
jgi:hypothetical protein